MGHNWTAMDITFVSFRIKCTFLLARTIFILRNINFSVLLEHSVLKRSDRLWKGAMSPCNRAAQNCILWYAVVDY